MYGAKELLGVGEDSQVWESKQQASGTPQAPCSSPAPCVEDPQSKGNVWKAHYVTSVDFLSAHGIM